MRGKPYKIKLWIDEHSFCSWDVRVKDEAEARVRCEHLKECCIKNGRFMPIKEEIELIKRAV